MWAVGAIGKNRINHRRILFNQLQAPSIWLNYRRIWLNGPLQSRPALLLLKKNAKWLAWNGVKISFQFEANYFGVSQLSFEANSRAI